jgi:hypothetical protein
MKRNPLILTSLAIFTAATAWAADPSPAATKEKSNTNSTTSTASAASVHGIDSYVREVESRASSLTRKEHSLSQGQLKKVTDENWTKVHTYWDGKSLKRMKLYPAAGSQKTEEFYYHNDQPVFVFVEENGAGKENHDTNAKGDKYYFANGSLIGAVSADGKKLDTKSPDSQRMADKLKKESQAFRAAAK